MHQEWMKYALQEAEKAYERAEVPIGAVVVFENEIIGRGHNLVEAFQDPTAHAEMLAIAAATSAISDWRLEKARIYVTLEPCPMCFGAIHLARMEQIVFAARDPRLGACGSKLDLTKLDAMTKPIEIVSGVEEKASATLIQKFFASLRDRKKGMICHTELRRRGIKPT